MDIEDTAFVGADDLRAEDAHKARQDDEVDIMAVQGGQQRRLKGGLGAGDDHGLDAGPLCALDGVGVGLVGYNK